MNRWKLTFEYEGSSFRGWQKQPDQRTAEGEIEKALSILCQTEIDIIGQGRTDAGVHARAQIAHADLPESFQKERIMHAMKGLLPQDIAMVDAVLTDPDFHARFDAVSRRYSYIVLERKSPLYRNRAWNCGYTLNYEILDDLAASVIGEHNFKNFCIPPEGSHLTTICTITESIWEQEGNQLIYYIEGNRFLRHMVRRLVGSMIQVASEKLDFPEFYAMLRGEKVAKKGHTAPAHGLYLEKVIYIK
ncbi:tRNA pseudouridine(38-40) synthase TruA [soil metagenome]